MYLDAHLQDVEPVDAGRFAASAEEAGFDGAWITEVTHSPFTLLTQMARDTVELDIGSAITVAFPRSPMVTAYSAWDLQSFSDGRLILGLGTQVKGHIERRFSMEWDSPGPRLRDYVRALQSIWNAWATGATVDYQGEFYTIDHCPPEFTPEPIDNPAVPIYVSAVNPFNLKLAGELCDGVHIHPVHSPAYISEVVIPNVSWGANRGNRSIDDISLTASVFAIIGETEDERRQQRDAVREQIAFYGSTRTYKTIFKVHGWENVCDKLHELSLADRWEEMGELVTDEMLKTFAIEARPEGLQSKIKNRYEHIDRLSLYQPYRGEDWWEHLIN